ncbi:TetR/AcrR family transcriptional regulator [Methanolobus sp.]|uniref:TetR/AcrR family transcriptional regulator n=1 Tax=Methanolobus sp. TaxID=1874737 RepID=UPI0025EF41AF|nr:TetR/AcrR family transcriptional regulator [Methanolobus sp.]
MSLREKKKQETRDRIFEISGRLFREKGFENTTVDEITQEAGIAKGTFFNYFPTKESLLLYFRERKEELVFNILGSQIATNAPAKDKIKNFLVLLAENYEKDKVLLRMLFFEHRRLVMASGQHPDRKQHGHGNQLRFISILRDLLKEGVENGEIKERVDLQIASETLHAVYFHSLMMWMHSDTDDSFSRDLSAKIDLVFEGIGE